MDTCRVTGNEDFALGRLFRLARLVRLVRASMVVWRVGANVRGVLETNGLGYVLLFMAALNPYRGAKT